MERMGAKKGQSAVVELKRKLSPMEKVVIVTSTFLGGTGFLRLVKLLDSSQLGFLGDFIHFWGVFALLITLTQEKTCAGLSLKSLQLTALYLAAKASYSFLMESGIPMFDVYSCLATLCVICMVRFKFKSIHVDNQENFNMLYLAIPCALLSLAIHPVFFCCYLRSVSLLPQLQLMRRRRIIEPFTAEYIFVLGAQRLLYVENWVIEILLTRGQSLTFLGDNMWLAFMAALSEVVNGFILADFCYYYLTMNRF